MSEFVNTTIFESWPGQAGSNIQGNFQVLPVSKLRLRHQHHFWNAEDQPVDANVIR